MRFVTDQMGRKIEAPEYPERIISLVPSQTELLYDLGLGERVIGITKFCVHPEKWFRSKTRIGGTKQLKFDIIDVLKPDLIIGNKEENEKGQVEALMEKYPVWMSDIFTLDDAFEMMLAIGELTGKQEKARELADNISENFKRLKPFSEHRPAAYFIWRKPYMAAGCDTFIHHILEKCGFANVFEAAEGRYPEIDEEMLKAANPATLLLSSEPYPFKEKHIEELQKILPDTQILLVDGELFSWYGSRLLYAADYFNRLCEEMIN